MCKPAITAILDAEWKELFCGKPKIQWTKILDKLMGWEVKDSLLSNLTSGQDKFNFCFNIMDLTNKTADAIFALTTFRVSIVTLSQCSIILNSAKTDNLIYL